ncbi:MAG: hypothetical protein Q9163_001329 [Psora crenata]
MVKPWLFVSPASRGIGLQLVKRLLRSTDLPVIATARKDMDRVREQIWGGLDADIDRTRLEVLQLDVTDESSVAAVADHCRSRFSNDSSSYLRLAFCIPGILHPEKSPAQINSHDSLNTFKVNALGPLLLSKHFSPFLPRKSVILEHYDSLPASAILALMSARVGSISDNALGGWYSYRASKAAVNSLAKSVDIYLRQRCGDNAMCVSLHPGTVKTGLSEEFWGSTPKGKLFTPEFAAERLTEVLKRLELSGRGKCWDWKGTEIPP